MLKSAKGPLLAAALAAGMTGLPAGGAFAQASSPNQIVGVWEAEDGIIKLEVFDAGGSYSGRMIYGKLLVEADGKTFKKDTLNPDPKLRSRSLEGIVFLTNLKWDPSDRRWEGGNWYPRQPGRREDGVSRLPGDARAWPDDDIAPRPMSRRDADAARRPITGQRARDVECSTSRQPAARGSSAGFPPSPR